MDARSRCRKLYKAKELDLRVRWIYSRACRSMSSGGEGDLRVEGEGMISRGTAEPR